MVANCSVSTRELSVPSGLDSIKLSTVGTTDYRLGPFGGLVGTSVGGQTTDNRGQNR